MEREERQVWTPASIGREGSATCLRDEKRKKKSQQGARGGRVQAESRLSLVIPDRTAPLSAVSEFSSPLVTAHCVGDHLTDH